MARHDPLDDYARSVLMAKVKSAGNVSTEVTVARSLRRARISGWRRHVNRLPGRPDFYFPDEALAMFVHGCFWHGCPRCYRPPKSNTRFWRKKVEGNRERDARVLRQLRSKGVHAFTIWEHELADARWIARLKLLLGRD